LGLKQYLQAAEAPGHLVWAAPRKEQIHDQTGLELIPLHGRSERNCRKLPEAQTLTAKGYSVLDALCKRRCPHLDYCGYLTQFAQEADFFAPQPLLQATRWWAGADVVVLDEFDVGRLTRLVALSISDLVAMGRSTACPHAHAILRWLSATIGAHGDCQLAGLLLLQALDWTARAEGARFSTTLRAAIDALPPAEEQNMLPGLPQQASLADYEQLPPGHLPTLLAQLGAEDLARIGGRRLTSRLEVRGGQLHLYLRQERLIAQLADPAQPKIILDASANVALLRAIFPDTPIQLEQPRIPIPARVIQVISRDWAKSTIVGERKAARRQRWIASVAEAIRPGRKTLVVSTLACEEALRDGLKARGFGDEIVVAHYGALRGSNSYKGYDVVLAQVYNPNLEAIIREGRALFANDAEPVDERVITVERTLSDTEGQTWSVAVTTFADARLAALLEARREEEMTQAALRGRPFDHPDTQITLLFSMPLPNLPPTEVVEAAPTPESNQGRQEATRQRLCAAAMQLLDEGGRVLSVAALAQAAGVSVTTVRSHWQAVARALNLRPSFRATRRTMPKGGARLYRAEVLVRRGRRTPPRARATAITPGQPPTMIDQADDQDPIPRLIHHRGLCFRRRRALQRNARVGAPRRRRSPRPAYRRRQ
jgi:hypothetical protein